MLKSFMIDSVTYIKLFLQIIGLILLSGLLGIIIVILRKKYEPKLEFMILNFFSKIFRKKIKGPLLIDTRIVARLEYNEIRRELWLNTDTSEKLLISPKYNSEPEKLIRYLILNPNRDIVINELVEKVKLSKRSSLSKLVSDLRFQGDLRKLFFNVSKTSIYLANPITSLHLRKSKISLKKILDEY